MTKHEAGMAGTATLQTVQGYLDETPYWCDGTEIAAPPLAPMQIFIWALASAGKFFEGMIVFMTGVMLPLLAVEFRIGAVEHGFVTAAPLFGILVGASLLGGLADVVGRRVMFITEMLIFTTFLVLVCFSPNWIWLVVCLFGIGLALGCDYPTAHLMLSETMPSKWRGQMILSAFAFQAAGAIFGTLIGYLILSNLAEIDAWHWMFASAILPAAIVTALRFAVVESPHWLLERGHRDAAIASVMKLLTRVPRYPSQVELSSRLDSRKRQESSSKFSSLFTRKHRRATILAPVPWFLQDLGTYGIGIFTPIVLASTFNYHKQHAGSVAEIIHNDILAAKGAAAIDTLLIVGILCAIFLSDRVGRIRLQIIGFIGCAGGLALPAFAATLPGQGQTVMIFIAFMLFNFMTNLGPNAQTYIIAGEVFPTKIRARGAGFAASFAKIGAVATAFLFPILLANIGKETLLIVLVGTSLIGALITYTFRIETGRTESGRDRRFRAASGRPARDRDAATSSRLIARRPHRHQTNIRSSGRSDVT